MEDSLPTLHMTYSLEQIQQCRDVLFKKKCWESFLQKNCEEVGNIVGTPVTPTDIRVCKVEEYDEKDIELNVENMKNSGTWITYHMFILGMI